MRPQLGSIWTALAVFTAMAVAVPQVTLTQSADSAAFTYNSRNFLFHSKPYKLIGGQMDPQRIPPEYWRDRLSKARAMGLNTIFSYVFWNLLEPRQGEWNREGWNDVAKYFKIAQEEGLNVVLRPGPYICGEREWGGFPSWLSQIPGMKVRTYNAAFLNASKSYLENLAKDLRDLQVTKGGPLLMVQVENEYGSYGSNHQYTAALRDMLKQLFDVPLYTNDGGVEWTLKGGEVPGVLAAIDGDPVSGFQARDRYITDKSELGPLLDGEYYTLWPDTWGPRNTHNGPNADQIGQFVKDMDFVLSANNSISLYMFHGGTNFGLSNGAIWKDFTAPWATTYDYGAPLDESGRTTELFSTLRKTIQKYVAAGSIPEPPPNVPRMSIPEIKLIPAALLDTPPATAKSSSPLTMEALGQSYGFVMYQHKVVEALKGLLQPGDRPRDRVLVYVNGLRKGVIDSTYAQPARVNLTLSPGDTLQLLVENLGRVNYNSLESKTFDALADPYKGIKGDVKVGGKTLKDWTMHSIDLDQAPSATGTGLPEKVVAGMLPVIYSGSFKVGCTSVKDPASRDTFISISNGIKGVVWVNGFNLGRYWVIGPQQSLYLPGSILKTGEKNEIVVLELEPGNQTMAAVGLADRVWENHPDPDAP